MVTDAWFVIHGANLNLTPDGTVDLVIDAGSVLAAYRALCEAEHGISEPPVVVIEN
jgi:hypothetical protein